MIGKSIFFYSNLKVKNPKYFKFQAATFYGVYSSWFLNLSVLGWDYIFCAVNEYSHGIHNELLLGRHDKNSFKYYCKTVFMLLKNSFQKSHYSNSNCTIGTLGHDKGLKTRVIVTFQNVIKIQTFQTGYETFLSFLNNVSFFCAKRLRIRGGIWQMLQKRKGSSAKKCIRNGGCISRHTTS